MQWVHGKVQEEEGFSLPAQEKFLKKYANDKGFTVIRVFSFAETASKDKRRKMFAEMMKYISQRDPLHLIVEKVDRLTRNSRDALDIDEWLAANSDRKLHLVKNGLILHKHSSSQDRFVWDIYVALAKQYVNNLREEVYKGRKEKLAQGWFPGKPPYGWMTVGEKGKKIHKPVTEKIALVKKLMEAYCEPNHSLTSVTKYAKEIGMRTDNGRPYGRSAITDNILKTPSILASTAGKAWITLVNKSLLLVKNYSVEFRLRCTVRNLRSI